ncbi:MAG: hypothetical protein P8173_10565, partial [Gammaproteobacteria bacterium]
MMNFKGDIRRTAVVAGLTAALFLLTAGASSAWADRGMTCHSGMGMGEHGHGMGMWKGMGHGMHPHNAAEHFLKMGTTLNLTDDQIKQLTKLRDEYIQKNATAEEELKHDAHYVLRFTPLRFTSSRFSCRLGCGNVYPTGHFVVRSHKLQ